jgi:hypothetical protein
MHSECGDKSPDSKMSIASGRVIKAGERKANDAARASIRAARLSAEINHAGGGKRSELRSPQL